ncbi:unnamed protein product, partial [Meganyctiphanes norvegica]
MDDVLTGLGLGRWQLLTVASTLMEMSLSPTQLFSSTFINAPVGYRCQEPGFILTDSNSSINGLYDNSCYKENHTIIDSSIEEEESIGERYRRSFVSLQSTVNTLNATSKLHKCNHWEYDTSVFESTFT